MKRILWLSKYPPTQKQREELKRLFGPMKLDRDISSFENAEDIVRRFREGAYDEMVAVAPLWVIMRLNELGLKPLWAQTEEVEKSQSEFSAGNRHYRFVKFRRVVGVHIQFEELE